MSAAQFEEVQKVSPLLAALVIGFIALVIAAVVTWTPEHELRASLPFLFAPFFLALTLFLTVAVIGVAFLGPALGNFAWTGRPRPVYPLDEETGWEPPDW